MTRVGVLSGPFGVGGEGSLEGGLAAIGDLAARPVDVPPDAAERLRRASDGATRALAGHGLPFPSPDPREPAAPLGRASDGQQGPVGWCVECEAPVFERHAAGCSRSRVPLVIGCPGSPDVEVLSRADVGLLPDGPPTCIRAPLAPAADALPAPGLPGWEGFARRG